MIITTDALNRTIKEGSDNLFLIYGEEDYFIEMAVNSIKKKYLTAGFEQMDSVKLDFGGKALNLERISENIELPPWSSLKRVVEIVNFDFDKEATEKIPQIISNIPESTLLLFVTDKIDKRKKKLFDAFDKNGVMCEVKHLEENVLMNYIKKGFSRAELTIDYEAGESIISRYDSSMRRIEAAIRRITLYCQATETKNIDYNIVDELCEPDIHANIFKIVDAVGDGDAGKALVLLDNLIKLKEPLPKIRFMIARHMRELIAAKELKNKALMVKRTGVRDFNAAKLIRQSSNYSIDRLLKLYNLCFRNDYDLKHGMADERASLESFIVLASGK